MGRVVDWPHDLVGNGLNDTVAGVAEVFKIVLMKFRTCQV